MKEAVKKQYKEIKKIQNQEINEKNQDVVDDLIMATEDLINNCIKEKSYNVNRDQNFLNATVICNRLSLKLESFKINNLINKLNEKTEELDKQQKIIAEKIKNEEDKSNNLVFNILGFIASFSIVSAAVTAIANIKGTLNIMIFIIFSILLLITTLIGLDNFYRNDKKAKNLLKSNYFLWIVLFFMFVILGGISFVRENIDSILNNNDVIENNLTELNISESQNGRD